MAASDYPTEPPTLVDAQRLAREAVAYCEQATALHDLTLSQIGVAYATLALAAATQAAHVESARPRVQSLLSVDEIERHYPIECTHARELHDHQLAETLHGLLSGRLDTSPVQQRAYELDAVKRWIADTIGDEL